MALPILYNSPFEAGVRATFLLRAIFPSSLDLERLLALGHLVVHTSDINGPPSLHPPTKTHASEMLVRRDLVERGLSLMQSRALLEKHAAPSGILYRAGAESASFVEMLTSEYASELRKCSKYVIDHFGTLSDEQFDQIVTQQLERWAVQFQPLDTV